jgi:hypothetical protein
MQEPAQLVQAHVKWSEVLLHTRCANLYKLDRYSVCWIKRVLQLLAELMCAIQKFLVY